jgi:hypothetical protein
MDELECNIMNPDLIMPFMVLKVSMDGIVWIKPGSVEDVAEGFRLESLDAWLEAFAYFYNIALDLHLKKFILVFLTPELRNYRIKQLKKGSFSHYLNCRENMKENS